MSLSAFKLKKLTAAIGTCLVLGASGPMLADTNLEVVNDGLMLSATVGSSSAEVLSMRIRIVGPRGFTYESRIENDQLQWIPDGDLPDGNYTWEIRIVKAQPGAEIRSLRLPEQRLDSLPAEAATSIAERASEPAPPVKLERFFRAEDLETQVIHGDFSVRDGWMVEENNFSEEISHHTDRTQNPIFRAIGAVLDFMVPSANAQNVEASGITPLVIWNRSATENFDYRFRALSGDLRLDLRNDEDNLRLSRIRFYRNMPTGSLSVRGVDDGNPGDSAQVGIGTLTPTEALHIDHRAPRIRIENNLRDESWFIRNTNATFAESSRFEIGTDQTFSFGAAVIPTSPFAIEAPTSEAEANAMHNALYIDRFGRVGMGTDEPISSLDIRGLAGSPYATVRLAQRFAIEGGNPIIGAERFAVRDLTSGNAFFWAEPGAPGSSLRIASDGNVGIGISDPQAPMEIRRADNTAEFRIQDNGDAFSLAMMRLAKTGHPRFRFDNLNFDDYRWEIGTFGAGSNESLVAFKVGSGMTQMRIFANGDMTIEGQLEENSSKELKHDITAVNSEELLARLRSLEISQWRYNHTPDIVRVGPMAEDWHQTFQVGRGPNTISPSDMAGIALGASRALAQENSELRARLEALENQLAGTQ